MRSPLPALLLLLIGAPTLARAQDTTSRAPIDSATLRAARHVLEIQHAGDVLLASVQASMEQERAAGTNTQIPPLFWDRFMTALRADVPNVLEEMAKVYARHFSKDELDQLAAFYQTPLGARFAKESGSLGAESSEVGRRWGGALAMRVMSDMIQKGEYTPPAH